MIRTVSATVLLSLVLSVCAAHADQSTAVGATSPNAAPSRITEALSRPKALPVLYVSFAALQVFDIYSTRQAMARGAREANPLMRDVVGNTGAVVAVKAAVVIGSIVAAERLWKKNKTAAIVVMAASNSVAAIVAARNARTLRQLR